MTTAAATQNNIVHEDNLWRLNLEEFFDLPKVVGEDWCHYLLSSSNYCYSRLTFVVQFKMAWCLHTQLLHETNLILPEIMSVYIWSVISVGQLIVLEVPVNSRQPTNHPVDWLKVWTILQSHCLAERYSMICLVCRQLNILCTTLPEKNDWHTMSCPDADIT